MIHLTGLKVFQEAKTDVLKVQLKLGKKKLAEDGSNQKNRIIKKIFYCRKKTLLQCSLFSKVLEIMKRYVLLFQQNEPAIFRIFPEQLVLFREVVLYFVRQKLSINTEQLNHLCLSILRVV